MKIIMRYKISRKILLCLTIFIGICALYGSTCMFIDPTGKILKMNNLLKYFEILPFSNLLFQNYIFSGTALLIINGLTNMYASFLIIKNKVLGLKLGSVFGITLMLWITIQFIIFPKNSLSITFFILGLIQFVVGYIAYVSYLQINFKLELNKYGNINKNKNNLIVYFSRTNYTKKIAYEKANELGAYILEIKPKEKIDGTLGFWWCGRYGMLKQPMEIEEININLKEFKNIIIMTPIWVFDISAPIRMFCKKYSKDIKNVEYIFTHYMKCDFLSVADEMDKLLNNKRKHFESICIRMGKVKKERYVNEI